MNGERASAIRLAATWLRSQSVRPSPVIPALRSRFGLTPLEAVMATRQDISEHKIADRLGCDPDGGSPMEEGA